MSYLYGLGRSLIEEITTFCPNRPETLLALLPAKKERENADQELSKVGDAQKAAMLLKTKEAGYAVIRHALSQAHMPEAVDTILAFALTMRKKRMGHHS